MEKNVLLPEQKIYRLWNPPIIKYNDRRDNWRPMGWSNLIFGSHDLHNVAKTHVNVVNDITTFDYPTRPTNIITNETILAQYIIKQELKVSKNKSRLQYKNNYSSFITAELSRQIILNTSATGNKEIYWYT